MTTRGESFARIRKIKEARKIDTCVVCKKKLPSEGALRKVRASGQIVPVHFECANDPSLTRIFG